MYYRIQAFLILAVIACFLRGLPVFDLGTRGIPTNRPDRTVAAICMVGSLVAGAILLRRNDDH